ncbi:MAG: hypothetical protein ABEJ03_04450 [Candidatus Nanohaloarchaea archaeon]
MFGLGEDNKHKLKENMDEIKHMVEGSGDEDDTSPDESRTNEPGPFDPQDSSEEEGDPGKKLQEEIEQFEDEIESQEEQEQGSKENSQNTEQPETGDQDSRGLTGKWEKDQEGRRESTGNGDRPRGSQNERGRVSQADIPEPAQTRDIDVPDIDKGPLFITQQKFERASGMLGSMRRLTHEIENTVASMEEDLERDRQKEQNIQKVLDEFEKSRREVENIVSPEKS